MSTSKPLTYAVFIIAVVGLGLASGYFNLPGAWYQSLAKPGFTPPNWLFAPAWTTLYVLIGIAGAQVWLKARQTAAMRIWFVQMVLNLAWSPAFFGQQNPALGLIVILCLLAAILAFLLSAWNRVRIAAILFLPYLAWVGFATALNGSIYFMN